MRKIIVLEFITLDGVIQAPGGPEEDESGKFEFGGWSAPFDDEASGKLMQKELEPADLLLGRKTFEIFSGYWPSHAAVWPGIMEVNKYVLSNTIKQTNKVVTQWSNSNVINSLDDIKKLKSSKGADLKIWGSSKLVHLLLQNDLIDEMYLKIHPVILGKGKKLFTDDSIPRSFTLTESATTPSGVIFTYYKKAGEVKTGTMGS